MKTSTKDRKTKHGEFIERELSRLRERPYVKVGILASSFSEDKKQGRVIGKSEPKKLTLGEVAVYNEFGTSDGRIPERSFIRFTHDSKRASWIRRTRTLQKRVMAGKMKVDVALGLMGEMIQADIKNRINSNIKPENKPATIRAKTRDGNPGNQTLVNFGQLLGSIHWSLNNGRNQ